MQCSTEVDVVGHIEDILIWVASIQGIETFPTQTVPRHATRPWIDLRYLCNVVNHNRTIVKVNESGLIFGAGSRAAGWPALNLLRRVTTSLGTDGCGL